MPLEFECDIVLLGSVSDFALSELLRIPLKWTYGSGSIVRSIRTVRKIHVKAQGVIRSESDGPQWTPSVPHENLEYTIDALEASAELLGIMRYLCRFIQPSEEWAEGGMKFGADGTLSLTLRGGLEIYRLFTQIVRPLPLSLSNQYPNLFPQLEDILSRNLVLNITINLGTQSPPIPIPDFEEIMLHTATIYARAWPNIMHAQTLRQPRYQWDKWSVFSIQYVEAAVDPEGRRCEFASYAQITPEPGSTMFTLGISHASRRRYRFVRDYGPFEVEEE